MSETCVCGHPQGAHNWGSDFCMHVPCECTKFRELYAPGYRTNPVPSGTMSCVHCGALLVEDDWSATLHNKFHGKVSQL